MGNRGPQAKGGYGEKTTVLSTRITATTRQALEDAAEKSGLSLSSEVERRLRRSFIEDEKIVDSLGGRQMYAILRMIAATMNMAGEQAFFFQRGKLAKEADWLLDPYAYKHAVNATVAVLRALSPEGETVPSRRFKGSDAGSQRAAEMTNYALENIGLGSANAMLDLVADSEPTEPEPSNKLTKKKKLGRQIAADLGALKNNLKKDSDDER